MMLATAQMPQILMQPGDGFCHAPCAHYSGQNRHMRVGNKENDFGADDDGSHASAFPPDRYGRQLADTHYARTVYTHAPSAPHAAFRAVDDSVLEPHQCLAALSEIAAAFQPGRSKPGNQHDGEADLYDAHQKSAGEPERQQHEPHHHHHHHQHTQQQHTHTHHNPALPQTHHAAAPQQGAVAFRPVAPAALDSAPPNTPPPPIRSRSLSLSVCTPGGPPATVEPAAAKAAAAARKQPKGRRRAGAAGKTAKQLRKAPASRRRRAPEPAAHRAAKATPRPAPAVQVSHLPKQMCDHKDEDGQWTTFLTDLPTVALNAFLKLSAFTEADIASLKKERRKRKCNVYTRRFRNKKATKATSKPSARWRDAAKAARPKGQQKCTAS